MRVNPGITGLSHWGCILIHEWAHTCGWEHDDAGGVPGTLGKYDPYECRAYWE